MYVQGVLRRVALQGPGVIGSLQWGAEGGQAGLAEVKMVQQH